MNWSRKLSCLAAVAAAIALPAIALGEPGQRAPGTINAYDFGFKDPATGVPSVTINAGETVTFAYPTGNSIHNVDFTAAQPTSCTRSDAPSASVPPLPPAPEPSGWSGTCRFNAPGTYDFMCDQHNFMTGTVEVQPAGSPTPTATATATATASPTAIGTASPTATPTPTAGATSTATASPSPSPTPSPGPSPTPGGTFVVPSNQGNTAPLPVLGAAASRLKVAKSQRGRVIKGAITVARAGSRVKIELLTKPSALGRKGKKLIPVGSASKNAGAGVTTFAVNLNATGKSAVRKKGKLALTVSVTVTPSTGAPFKAAAAVTVKR